MNEENIDKVIKFLEKYHTDRDNFVKIEKNILLSFIEDIPYEDFKKGFYIYVKSKNLKLRDVFIDSSVNDVYLKSLFHKFYKKDNIFSYDYIDYDKLSHKINYKYSDKKYYLGLINQNLTINHISNFYQLDNRLNCDLMDRKSAIYGFENELIPIRLLYRNVFKKEKKRYFDKEVFRYIFGYNYGIASNFSVNSAKLIYEKLKGKKVIDTSSGWGDRLAAFYLSYYSEEYVGMDPNPKVYETYKTQIINYEKFLENKDHKIIDYGDHFVSHGIKKVTIYNCGMEDFPYENYKDYFDLYFTSPPYFNTELYSDEHKENQSWYKYPTYDSWKNDFLLNTFNKLWKAMKQNSYFCVNIIDPKDRKKNRLPLCDDMIDEICKYENSNYIGFYCLRLSNISSKKEEMKKLMYEPIWIFKKSDKFNLDSEINKIILKKEGLF